MMCFRMMRAGPAPPARAASTYSLSRDEDLSADDPRVDRPEGHDKGQDQDPDPAIECREIAAHGGEGHENQKEAGDGEEDVREPHDRLIEVPSTVPCHRSEQQPHQSAGSDNGGGDPE